MFLCESVELDYLERAPIRVCATVGVRRPPSEVFAAFAHDPANWGEFVPGFDRAGRYLTSEPHGVGSRCAKGIRGLRGEQTILAWNRGAQFAFRVDCTSAPVFRAWVEDYRFEPDGTGGTLLSVTIGGDPRFAFKLVKPVLPRAISLLLKRVGHNLEHGRWYSTT